VDGAAVVRWAQADRAACLEPAAVGEWLSQSMQQRLGLEDFRPAVLLGRGAGAWVVHSLRAQAPEGVAADLTKLLEQHARARQNAPPTQVLGHKCADLARIAHRL